MASRALECPEQDEPGHQLIHCHLTMQGRLDLVERVGQILNTEIFDLGEGSVAIPPALLLELSSVHVLGPCGCNLVRHFSSSSE
jgi:hypothetical protein